MPFPLPGESSRPDANQNLSLTVVQGSAGTSTAATISTMALGGDPATGALYVNNIGAPSGNPTSGTLNTLGTVGTLQAGTVTINGGTLNAGTFTNSGTNVNIVTGSLVGTILGGTINNVATGTINALASGTITTGTVSVTIGSVVGPNASAGTSTTAPIQVGGTTATGTVYGLKTDTSGLLHILQESGTTTVVSSLTNGSINILSGSLVGTISGGTLQNLNAGTITALASGTITGGTLGNLNYGTVAIDALPTRAIPTFGTHGTTGASVFGTLVGGTSSGAGTEIFITSLSLTIPSTAGSQDVSIGWGTNGGTFHAGTGLLVRGNFPAGGGIQKQFAPASNSGTNAQLTYFQAGAGTVDISTTYFVTASTL